LAVAVDASTLGSLFTVLCISVVYRGCAIPVAWKILPATAKASWKKPWLKLLGQFKGIVPVDYQVIVLADRGLYAKGLFMGIRKLHWHPMLRVNQTGKFRPKGWYHFVPLSQLAPHIGSRWQGQGTAFATKQAQLKCTLLAYWGEGHEQAWLIVTDLAAEQSAASWYGLPRWIEQFFKDAKRGGWQWQHTRMQQAERAERLWLALAVATLWLVRVGGADEDKTAAAGEMPELMLDVEKEHPRSKRWRLVSVFARGWVVLISCLINHQRQPKGALIPEPWPFVPQTPRPAQTPSKMP
jgi:Transposase DDE domain